MRPVPVTVRSTRQMKSTLAALAAVFLLVSCGYQSSDGSNAMAQVVYAGKVNAPDFPEGLQWLNTDHPVSLKELRGKVVLLDFWTFCCINCMHVIPDLKRLEAKYPSELVVIGVHSAKFTTEQGTENIREAILRYGLEHPVVNDKDFEIWNSYGVHAWPTFVIIDPDGKIVGQHSGEGIYDLFDQVIGRIIREFDARGQINRNPVHFALEENRAPASYLAFPGKIATDQSQKRLYITDSNHNRVLIVSIPDGGAVDVIGQGEAGLKDGTFNEARFNKPQGIAVDGDAVYVADTENHAIRKIDLAQKTVTTLAGNGMQAAQFNVPGTGRSVQLNSPWDLLVHDGKLYVAMAGSHQIWTLDLKTLEAKPYAGSGRENIIDGPLRDAAFAQPSGITTDGTVLYTADSEVSGVREVPFSASGAVHTIVGKGLFDFGDIDGTGSDVRLQHPIGILYHNGLLYVADTYNNKIKQIDPKTRKSVTLIGTGKTGLADGDALHATLNEPNGLVFASGKFYITDTNNHLIRIYDPATKMVSTLQLKNVEKLVSTGTKRTGFKGELVQIPEQEVGAGNGSIDVTVRIPPGYKLNAEAPFYIGYASEDSGVVRLPASVHEQNIQEPIFPITIPVTFGEGKTGVQIDLAVYYCAEGKENLCLIKQLRLSVPVRVVEGNGTKNLLVETAVLPEM
jgi:DNA-binding beta-propeller fold protein YncE